MVGVLLVGVFVAVVAVYVCTEFLMARFDARRRVLIGDRSPLLSILAANLTSFLIVWLSSLVFLFAAGIHLYDYATIVCLCAQGVWLSQHLWFYHRNHLNLRYE